MKNCKLLLIILLASVFVCTKCSKSTTDNGFSFDNSLLQRKFTTSDKLKIALRNAKELKIDSIAYFIDDNKMGSKKVLNVFEFYLKDQKLGLHNLRADIFYEGEIVPQKIVSTIEIVSSITPKLLQYEIVNTYPHDIEAYTQGLEFYRDTLFEGTGNGAGASGRKGKSSLRKVNYKTGKVYSKIEYPDNIFGEGITILNNKVYQLTWKNNEVFVYNADNFKKEKTLPYHKNMEGWGLTTDGKKLYMTDSSAKMHLLDAENFKPVGDLTVYSGDTQVPALNELEYVDGKIYGNVYQKDAIAVVNPQTGSVESIVNLKDLQKKISHLPDTDVLNGIAYRAKTKTFFVTGKNWDKMFEIRILQAK